VEAYVGGVAQGYLNANGYLSSTKQAKMFCYAGDIKTNRAMEIATQAVDEHLALRPSDIKSEMLELLMLMKLKTLYPC
jgi:hypothetical protein